jgi:hypothetical protein
MTADRDAARALRALFDDDVTVMPGRVLDAVLAEIPVTRQQRRWPWSSIPIRSLQLVAAMAVLAVAITAGLGLMGRSGGIGGPPSSPTPGPSPTASPTRSPIPSSTPAPGYATPPAGWPTPAVLVPASPLPSPSGSPLPADLIGREYTSDPPTIQGIQAEVLTLRAADDPHCAALYGGSSTCFTILWTPNYPKHVNDPAVRGPARIVDGKLELGFALVPNDPECEGTTSIYAISADGWTLDQVDAPNCSYRRFVRH